MKPHIGVHPKGARTMNLVMSLLSVLDNVVSILSLGFFSSDFAICYALSNARRTSEKVKKSKLKKQDKRTRTNTTIGTDSQ